MVVADIYAEQQRDELTETEFASYRQALELARQLPFALQLDLAQNIIGIVREESRPPRRKNGYTRTTSRGKTANPTPTNEQVAPMLEEARLHRLPTGGAAPLNPMYYIEEARIRRGFVDVPTEEQMRQLIGDYQAETGRTLSDEQLERLLFDMKMEYQPHVSYEPPDRMAFRERSLNRPSTQKPGNAYEQIAGRMKTRHPAPTDEEVRDLLEEARLERYGHII